MDCYCQSKHLYNQSSSSYPRKTHFQSKSIFSPQQQTTLIKTILDSSEVYLPAHNHIDRVSVEQIYQNPKWFQKYFISANRPCLITGVDLQDICETWSNPNTLKQMSNGENVRISLTPDGFADSIKGQYFIEPQQIQAPIDTLINWQQQQNIPYIQHQNNNLNQQKQFQELSKQIPTHFNNFISNNFFQSKAPDASNFWMGYEQSVSALHKDPYDNFYTTIVGEKHFTLLPPIAILYLQEAQFRTARWKMVQNNQNMILDVPENIAYPYTKWIVNNPDRKEDYSIFPEMKELTQFHIHTVVEPGDTLFLPALWYHQVSQSHRKNGSSYVIATNHWYDMQFTHVHTLYETCRTLKGY